MTNKNIKALENVENQNNIKIKTLSFSLSKIFSGVFFDRKRNVILTEMIINDLCCFCQN